MKILTIGPFPPLRGGISDFHYSLFNEFSKNHDVSVLSFKKLYPSILFPGKNQYHDKHVDVDSVYNILNPINIFSWFRAKKIMHSINADRIMNSSFCSGYKEKMKLFIINQRLVNLILKRFIVTPLIMVRLDYLQILCTDS